MLEGAPAGPVLSKQNKNENFMGATVDFSGVGRDASERCGVVIRNDGLLIPGSVEKR